jgi:hypothetical protein
VGSSLAEALHIDSLLEPLRPNGAQGGFVVVVDSQGALVDDCRLLKLLGFEYDNLGAHIRKDKTSERGRVMSLCNVTNGVCQAGICARRIPFGGLHSLTQHLTRATLTFPLAQEQYRLEEISPQALECPFMHRLTLAEGLRRAPTIHRGFHIA